MEEDFTPRGRKKSYTERIKPSIRPILKEAVVGWDSSSSVAVLSPISELKKEDKRIKQRSHSDPFINSWEYGQHWLTDSSETRHHRTQSTPPKQNPVDVSSPISSPIDPKRLSIGSQDNNIVSPESKKDKKLKKKLKKSKESSSPMSSREDIHQHSPLRLSLIYKNILEELEGHDLRFKTTRRGAKILLAGSVAKMLRCLMEKSWEDPNTPATVITSPTSLSVGRSRSDSNVVRKWRRKYDEYKLKSDGDMFVIYFILTHSYFIPTLNLLEELIKRFNQATDMLKNNELAMEERTFQSDIKSRILFIIKRWLTYSIDDLLEEKLSEVLLNFMKELDNSGNKEQYDSLYRVYKISLLQKNSINTNISQELDKKEQKIKAIKTFSDVPSYIIARQMSLMDFKAFSSLKSRDLVHLHWKENNIRVSDIFANFTGMSLWVATEILSFPNIKQRTNVLAKFITLCEELIGMNNYQGAAAIYTGLSLPPISRLDQTWKNLDLKYEKLPSVWTYIQALFSPSNNYEQYRDRIKKSTSPLIPYHIIYLQDLEEIENHYKDRTDDNLVNWRKLRKIGRIVATIKKYQQSPYIYAPNGLIQEFLSKLGVLDIDKLAELSKKYETSIEVITPVNRSLTLRDPLRRKINKSKQQTNALRNIVNNSTNSSIQPYRRASFIVINENNDNNNTDPIIDTITDSKYHFIDLLCMLNISDVNTVIKVAKSVSILFEVQYKSMVLMKKLIFREIETHGAEFTTKSSNVVPIHLIANYFKQDNLFSNQILQQYCILVGKSYLSKSLSPILKKITSKQKTYEISPDKISKKDDPKVNLKNITKLVNKLLTSILSNVDECPYPIRILCIDIRETMEKQGHKDVSIRASIAFLFYRFLCPAIHSPDFYDIYEKNISKDIKRALELASKIIRGLIFAEIPTDPYLREPILQLTPLFKRPIEEFVDKLNGETPEVAYDFEVSISNEDQKQSCLLIRNFIVDNLKYLDSIPSSNSKLLNPFLMQKVFGYPLYAVIRREATSLGIPTILEKSMKFLIDKIKTLELEGIFRISGESDKVQTLKTTFDNGEYVDLTNEDPYVVADVIKLYLKSLPDSLIPSCLFDDVSKIATLHDKDQIVVKMKHIIASLPSENKNVLKHLVNFLIEISNYSSKTMMGSHNLALMFGPNIVRQPKSDTNNLNNNVFSTGNDFLETLMEHKDQYLS